GDHGANVGALETARGGAEQRAACDWCCTQSEFGDTWHSPLSTALTEPWWGYRRSASRANAAASRVYTDWSLDSNTLRRARNRGVQFTVQMISDPFSLSSMRTSPR